MAGSSPAFSPSPAPSCPVCRSTVTDPFMTVRERTYRRCPVCSATFLVPWQLPAPAVERRRYDQHNNSNSDARYVEFLRRLADPLLAHLAIANEADANERPRRGLDFGSGPVPVLADLLRSARCHVECYDPFYAPREALLEGAARYDFITCCEVAEHLHDPAREFQRLRRLLRPGGILGIMTEFQTDDTRFARWYYREDVSHVVFYREETLRHVAHQLGMTITIPRKNVALLQAAAADRPRRNMPPGGPSRSGTT